MKSCIDATIGSMILDYELNRLNEEEQEMFELHLMDCDFCLEQVKSMERVMDTINSNPKIYSKILKNSILEKSADDERAKSYKVSFGKKPQLFGWLLRPVPITVAASLVLIIGIYFVFINYYSQTKNEKSIISTKHDSTTNTKQTPSVIEKKQDLSQNKKDDNKNQISKEDQFPQIFEFRTSETRYDDLAVNMIEHKIYSDKFSNTEENTEELRSAIQLYNKKDYNNAIEKFKTILRDTPDNEKANFYLGLCYLLSKEYTLSIKFLDMSAKLNSGEIKEYSLYWTATAYLKINNGPKALEYFNKINWKYINQPQKEIQELKKRINNK
ncbi:MAG: hypothetical protein WCT77_02710 [Bacteroidota bacterium]|jgi:TolA-binding protein